MEHQGEGFHPILVANARVDWLAMNDFFWLGAAWVKSGAERPSVSGVRLAMNDDDITKKFPILLEDILQDVYSQRAASAWQGAQPQKLTVSIFFGSVLLGSSPRRSALQSAE